MRRTRKPNADAKTAAAANINRAAAVASTFDGRFGRLTELRRDCPVCGQLAHYRCRDAGTRTYVPTHVERL